MNIEMGGMCMISQLVLLFFRVVYTLNIPYNLKMI